MSVFILPRPISDCPKTGKPRKRYHVRWAHDDTYTYLGSLPSAKDAEARKRLVEGLVAIGAPVSLDIFKGRPAVARVRLDEAGDLYLASGTGWAESTLENKRGYVKAVLEYWGGHRDPAKITPEEVTAYIASMKAAELSAATQRLRKGALAGMLDAAKVRDNPVRDGSVGKIKGKAKRKPLPTAAELAATRAALDPEARICFDFMEHSGMRPSEARLLTWEQVDNALDRLVAVGSKTVYERTVPRLDFQPDWIPQRPEHATGLIVHLTEPQLYARIKKASSGKINPNLLRHVHASRLLSWKGVKHDMGIPDMAARMGHSHEHFMGTYTHRIAPLD